jgi:hypothetical protein
LPQIRVKFRTGDAEELSYPAGVSLLEICREQEDCRSGAFVIIAVFFAPGRLTERKPCQPRSQLG